jgi:hypothetical protein
MHSTNKDMHTLAAHRFIANGTRPRTAEEENIILYSYELKKLDCQSNVVAEAAHDMAKLINENCNLIPAPDHTGDTSANRRLANYIRDNVTGHCAEVHDILGRTQEVESNCVRHTLRKPPLHPYELCIVRCNHKLIKCQKTYIVDNVTTNGTTIAACVYALGFGTGLVYADAHHDTRN